MGLGMNDLDKRRLAVLQKRHDKYMARSKAHLLEGQVLAETAFFLFADFRQFWNRVNGEKKTQ